MSYLTEKAREFAIAKHGTQKYGEHPYFYHLDKVVGVLTRFGIEHEVLICSALLHDTIEDTGTTFEEVKEVFGEEIANAVYAVTDELGRNREERKGKTYPKIRRNLDARIVKLADRIANTEESIKTSEKKFKMYKEEFWEFHLALYGFQTYFDHDSSFHKMWRHLAELNGMKERFDHNTQNYD